RHASQTSLVAPQPANADRKTSRRAQVYARLPPRKALAARARRPTQTPAGRSRRAWPASRPAAGSTLHVDQGNPCHPRRPARRHGTRSLKARWTPAAAVGSPKPRRQSEIAIETTLSFLPRCRAQTAPTLDEPAISPRQLAPAHG